MMQRGAVAGTPGKGCGRPPGGHSRRGLHARFRRSQAENHAESQGGRGRLRVEHGGDHQPCGGNYETRACRRSAMFVDAVHFAPHGLVDVKALDCDFLVCSPYKFFGPHLGTLYGKREHLERFKPYKVRPATDAIPDCWETGTQVQELIAGIGAAVEYIAELGRHRDASAKSRREAFEAAYRATVPYERTL